MLVTSLRVGLLTGDDLPPLLELNAAAGDFPPEHLRTLLLDRGSGAVGKGAWVGSRLVGYVVLGLHTRSVEVVTVAVRPSCRRQGIGSTLVNLAHAYVDGQRRRVLAVVRDSNLDAQLFFRRLDFLAVTVRHGHFGGVEDAYVMHWAGGRTPLEVQADLLLDSAFRGGEG